MSLALCSDAYIRLKFTDLQTIPLVHLISGLDEYSPGSPYSSAVATQITGYTEWVSTDMPTITLGWDWQIDVIQDHTLPTKINEPRSNIMLHDSKGRDIGYIKTTILLGELIDELDWQMLVLSYIEKRYEN